MFTGDIMFREMRRKRQQLSDEETEKILRENTSGVLALIGDGGYPYAVPLSYVYADGKIYFHSAKTGHKLDAVRSCEKASFCVTDRDEVHGDELTTYFRSVIAFGTVRIIEAEEEMLPAVWALGRKYLADNDSRIQQEIDRDMKHMSIIEFTVEHMTGKEAIELVRDREK